MATRSVSRLGLMWVRARDSLWFLPTTAAVAGTLLAAALLRVPDSLSEHDLLRRWMFDGGAEGARGVLSVIAGSLITVTGTVFSVTIVALQLASSQFSPRLLRSFVADRVNQAVLAAFIGTFIYTLLVLRTIHSDASDREAFVPQFAVTVALLLLLVSIGALIVFINHAAQSIQASVILERETRRILEQAHTWRERPGEDADVPIPAGEPLRARAQRSGYLQGVDADALWRLAPAPSASPLIVRSVHHVGSFVLEGMPVAEVWLPGKASDDVTAAVGAAFVLGSERTLDQDLELGIIELADIAVRALSPGVNDPTTAMHCIDRLTQVLGALADTGATTVARKAPDGRVVLVEQKPSFERLVSLAFGQVRHHGAGNPTIVRKLLASLLALRQVVPPACVTPLSEQARRVLAAARRALTDEADVADAERLAGQVVARPS